mgnify:CR=1 FL=1
MSTSDSFDEALASLRQVTYRPEFEVEEAPAPARLAPFSVALSADVVVDNDELAMGRFVLLHDPDGVEEWDGNFRVVTFIRAELDPETAADPLLFDVGWSWLRESIEGLGARALGGAITINASQSYGTMADRPGEGTIEVRASWTPPNTDVGQHVRAWIRTLETAAGLEPLPDGVTMLPLRRSSP